jgi:hypothetical protein
MPHVSRVQGGEYPSSAEGTRQSCLFNLGIVTEGGREQADHVQQGTAIKRSFAVFASENDVATG